jgi:hypothetical protein
MRDWLKKIPAVRMLRTRIWPRCSALRKRIVGRLIERPSIAWRSRPISTVFGFDRGMPIDRHYIGQFLESNRASIKGQVLEFGDDQYFGTFAQPASTVSIFHAVPGNAEATIIGDLGSPALLEGTNLAFDCIICTQVLQFIFPVREAVRNLYSMLNSGGVLLISVPGISQISRYDMDRWGDYWRFTSLGLRKLLEETCPDAAFEVSAYGNVLAAVGFLHGLAVEDIGVAALDQRDSDYEVLICARCKKPSGGAWQDSVAMPKP